MLRHNFIAAIIVGPAQRFAALIRRRESKIRQLPVKTQRTLGAFFRQQKCAMWFTVVFRDRQLYFIATKLLVADTGTQLRARPTTACLLFYAYISAEPWCHALLWRTHSTPEMCVAETETKQVIVLSLIHI